MKLWSLVLILLTVVLLQGCHSVTPDPGQVAVLIKKPILPGFQNGVVDKAIQPGRTYAALTTQVVYVDIVPEAHKVTFDDFASRDNIVMDLDTTVTLKITDAVTLIENFGPNWFTNNVESPYSQLVRDIVKTQTMRDMMSNPTTATDMDAAVTKQLETYLAAKHIPIEVVSVTLGHAKPTPTVLAQINDTAVQQQRQLTEAAAATAEDARKAAETARADADDAYRQAMGYTTEQYAQMQIANIQAQACAQAKECIIAPPGSPVIANSGK